MGERVIKERQITQFFCNYHRNGVGGAGFHACTFVFNEGRTSLRMKAAVWEEPGVVSVLSDNIAECWRGDDFEPHLRRLIAEAG